MDIDAVATRVRRARMKRGLTQKEVAVKVDICRATYINLEKGRRYLPHEQMVKLYRVLKLK
jgi:DNA-binding XRE family transcriptional regulator